MNQWQSDKICQPPSSSARPQTSQLDSRQRLDVEGKDPVIVRKVQKADREKLRRDRLNEQFQELGNALDPDRPKNDKATILMDTVQLLKELTDEVSRLKSEYTALSEESRELTQEKSELREEKASLKLDIENLNMQHQQRARVMFPWPPVEPSVVMGPPYSYPVPMAAMGPGPIPMHPSLQPYPFFGSQNPNAIPSHCPPFIPYPTPPIPHVEQPHQQAPTSHVPCKPDVRSKASDSGKARNVERHDGSNDVATELELKTPGSAGLQESSRGGKKGKQMQRVERSATDGGSSSTYSCQGPQDSSSSSVGPNPKPDK